MLKTVMLLAFMSTHQLPYIHASWPGTNACDEAKPCFSRVLKLANPTKKKLHVVVQCTSDDRLQETVVMKPKSTEIVELATDKKSIAADDCFVVNVYQ
jgi:hypothetical protein